MKFFESETELAQKKRRRRTIVESVKLDSADKRIKSPRRVNAVRRELSWRAANCADRLFSLFFIEPRDADVDSRDLVSAGAAGTRRDRRCEEPDCDSMPHRV
jgi:hypothetical protein